MFLFQASGCPVQSDGKIDRKLAQAALATASSSGCPSKHGSTYVSECPSSGAVAMKPDEVDPLNAVSQFLYFFDIYVYFSDAPTKSETSP